MKLFFTFAVLAAVLISTAFANDEEDFNGMRERRSPQFYRGGGGYGGYGGGGFGRGGYGGGGYGGGGYGGGGFGRGGGYGGYGR